MLQVSTPDDQDSDTQSSLASPHTRNHHLDSIDLLISETISPKKRTKPINSDKLQQHTNVIPQVGFGEGRQTLPLPCAGK